MATNSLRLSNVDAVYAEYPFLEGYMPRSTVKEIHVQRWDDAFLGRSAEVLSCHDRTWNAVLLLDENGELVDEVGKWDEPKKFNLPSWLRGLIEVLTFELPRYIHRETVGQALHRIGRDNQRRIRYALSADMHQPTLHKLPRGFENAADWLASQIEKNRETIRDV